MAPKKTISEFRKTLRRSLLLNTAETKLFDRIPDAVLEGIFRHNFDGNLAMAERVLFNRYREVDGVDRIRLEQEKQNIFNLGKASRHIAKALAAGENVLFITDNDNDGSLAQAILIEFKKTFMDEWTGEVDEAMLADLAAALAATREPVLAALASVPAADWPPA